MENINMTTVYKCMDGNTILCVCMDMQSASGHCDQMIRLKANRNLLATGPNNLSELFLNDTGSYRRYNRLCGVTEDQINAEKANVTQYTIVTDTL